jgi:hypothetical protein
MDRRCTACGEPLAAYATRCRCGAETPERRDALSVPERPQCALCGQPIDLMQETCPSCGARGFPALRGRRGRGSKGPPPEARSA